MAGNNFIPDSEGFPMRFIQQGDDENDTDVMTRAFSGYRIPASPGIFTGGEAIKSFGQNRRGLMEVIDEDEEVEQPQQQRLYQNSGVAAAPQILSEISARTASVEKLLEQFLPQSSSSGNKKSMKKSRIDGNRRHKVKKNLRSTTKLLSLYYIGTRRDSISPTVSLCKRDAQVTRPVSVVGEKFAEENLNMYCCYLKACRQFLLSIIAPNLREHFHLSDGSVDMEATAQHYRENHVSLEPFGNKTHFILCFDHNESKLVYYSILINFHGPTANYNFPHWRMHGATRPSANQYKCKDNEGAINWIKENVDYEN